MKRRALFLFAVAAAFSLSAQIFGPGGVVQTSSVGTALGGQMAKLPQPRSLVFVQPPVQGPMPIYGPQPIYPMMSAMRPEPTNYTLPATILGGVIGGYLGQKEGGKTTQGAAIGAAAGLFLGQVLDRQSERRSGRTPMHGPLSPYAGYPSMYGSVMVITPPRIPASWPATAMFGRQPYIVGPLHRGALGLVGEFMGTAGHQVGEASCRCRRCYPAP